MDNEGGASQTYSWNMEPAEKEILSKVNQHSINTKTNQVLA